MNEQARQAIDERLTETRSLRWIIRSLKRDIDRLKEQLETAESDLRTLKMMGNIDAFLEPLGLTPEENHAAFQQLRREYD